MGVVIIPSIKVRKSDVIWSYIGTILSYGSSFILLPVLVKYLSEDELGLWYSYTAVGNLVLLFEMGFNPTFARNIVYCLSGAKRLTKEGSFEYSEQVDWHLTAAVLRTSKLIYAGIAAIALAIMLTIGNLYVGSITSGLQGNAHWIAWLIFVAAIFLNLFYLWTLTFLRGFGDIAGENKSKTYAKMCQLVVTFILCCLGMGIVGAALGFFAYSGLLRFFAWRELRNHKDVLNNARNKGGEITRLDIKAVLATVSNLAIKDGIVEISLYIATQATSIICSLYLSLAETGMYSLQLQLANAVSGLSSSYLTSCYPAYQSAYANNNKESMRNIVKRGFSIFWVCALVAIAGVLLVVFPVLPLFRPSAQLNAALFVALACYACIVQQYSSFCVLIVATNRMPYVMAYIVSSAVGIALSAIAMRLGYGLWGLVCCQLIAQCAYNVWYWPSFVLNELRMTWVGMMNDGIRMWIKELVNRGK